MDKKIISIVKILTYLIMAFAVVLQVLVLANSDLLDKDNMFEALSSPILNNYFFLTAITLCLTILLAVGFPLAQMISKPKDALKGIGYVVALVVIAAIAYALAGNEFSNVDLVRLKTTASVSKMVGASIIFTYIVGGAAVLSILYASISNALK